MWCRCCGRGGAGWFGEHRHTEAELVPLNGLAAITGARGTRSVAGAQQDAERGWRGNGHERPGQRRRLAVHHGQRLWRRAQQQHGRQGEQPAGLRLHSVVSRLNAPCLKTTQHKRQTEHWHHRCKSRLTFNLGEGKHGPSMPVLWRLRAKETSVSNKVKTVQCGMLSVMLRPPE